MFWANCEREAGEPLVAPSPQPPVPTHSLMAALELQYLYHLVKQGADVLGVDLWLLLFCLISFKLCQLIKDMEMDPWQDDECGTTLTAPLYALGIRWVREGNGKLLKFLLKFHYWLLFLVCTSAKLLIWKTEIFGLSKKSEGLSWCKSCF